MKIKPGSPLLVKIGPARRLLLSILIIILSGIFIIDVADGIAMDHLAARRAALKRDYSAVNDIRFGLLSVNTWRDNMTRIASNRIADFSLTASQKADLQVELSRLLNSLITSADSMVQKSGGSLGGKIKKLVLNTVVPWKQLHRNTPEFSQAIVKELEKPENRYKLKSLVIDKINDLAGKTREFAGNDTTLVPRLLAIYHAATVDDFNRTITSRINRLQRRIYFHTFVIIGSMIVFLTLWLFITRLPELRRPLFNLSVALALLMLIASLVSPMIEIDARIKKLDFELLGEHLMFNDQVIFFQSKSILDVVRILLDTKKADSMLVGVLLLAFSVVFPIAKLISTEIYLLGSERLRRNRLVLFFAFKSGKWSMADVMVVAIFMAYIGFKGILDNQLAGLNFSSPGVTSIATNLTSLQPGYILFVTFVLFGMILSSILHSIPKGSGR